MTDFTNPSKKLRTAAAKIAKPLPAGLFSGGSEDWDEERKKAVARTIANMSVREAKENGIPLKDLRAARMWYAGSTKGGEIGEGATQLKKNIAARQKNQGAAPRAGRSGRGGAPAAKSEDVVTFGSGSKPAKPVPESRFLIQTERGKVKRAPKNPYKVGTAEHLNWSAQQATKKREELATSQEAYEAALASVRKAEAVAAPKTVASKGGSGVPGSSGPAKDVAAAVGKWLSQGTDTHKNRIAPGTPRPKPLADKKKKSGVKKNGKDQYYGGR